MFLKVIWAFFHLEIFFLKKNSKLPINSVNFNKNRKLKLKNSTIYFGFVKRNNTSQWINVNVTFFSERRKYFKGIIIANFLTVGEKWLIFLKLCDVIYGGSPI